MNVWIAMKGALTVMDLVTRGWARQLEIDECGVMALGRVVEMAVNRPSADGWRKGLIEPHELKKVPLGYEISIEDELLEMSETEGSIDGDEVARKDRERERAEREWHSMWMRLSS